MATKATYGWIRKGKNKVIETTGTRTRGNVIGAINAKDPKDLHTKILQKKSLN
jgi:hypothetical protein